MASLAQLEQELFDRRNGQVISVTKVKITGSSDTVVLPEGIVNAAHVTVIPIDSSDTAASVSSISQGAHPAGVTVTLAAGGTANSNQFVVALHHGNAAGL